MSMSGKNNNDVKFKLVQLMKNIKMSATKDRASCINDEKLSMWLLIFHIRVSKAHVTPHA